LCTTWLPDAGAVEDAISSDSVHLRSAICATCDLARPLGIVADSKLMI
jgi:hypothetical protein